jgi:hypothetical protein
MRWPAFAGAVLGEGIRAAFAMPILITSACVGAFDLFATRPGPLYGDRLSGGMRAAELASIPLLDLAASANDDVGDDAWNQLATWIGWRFTRRPEC